MNPKADLLFTPHPPQAPFVLKVYFRRSGVKKFGEFFQHVLVYKLRILGTHLSDPLMPFVGAEENPVLPFPYYNSMVRVQCDSEQDAQKLIAFCRRRPLIEVTNDDDRPIP